MTLSNVQNPINIFPSFDAPTTAVQRQIGQPKPVYRKSWMLNFVTGDLASNGSGGIVIGDGWAAWAQWCMKTVLTERYMYMVYTRQYGVEITKAVKRHPRKAVESAITTSFTEALTRDRRTKEVRDFRFRWSGDSLTIHLTCVPVVGTTNSIKVTLTGV